MTPSEVVQRCYEMGCRGLAITDHVDSSNLDLALSCLLRFLGELQNLWAMEIILGVELTHVPPAKVEKLINKARTNGACWVVRCARQTSAGLEPREIDWVWKNDVKIVRQLNQPRWV